MLNVLALLTKPDDTITTILAARYVRQIEERTKSRMIATEVKLSEVRRFVTDTIESSKGSLKLSRAVVAKVRRQLDIRALRASHRNTDYYERSSTSFNAKRCSKSKETRGDILIKWNNIHTPWEDGVVQPHRLRSVSVTFKLFMLDLYCTDSKLLHLRRDGLIESVARGGSINEVILAFVIAGHDVKLTRTPYERYLTLNGERITPTALIALYTKRSVVVFDPRTGLRV